MRKLYLFAGSCIPSIAHASDMGPLMYFLSIPIGIVGLIVSIIISATVKVKLASIIVVVLAFTSLFFGASLLGTYSYETSGSIYTVQQIAVFGFIIPLLIVGYRAYQSKEKSNA